jgi:hypothetical protein
MKQGHGRGGWGEKEGEREGSERPIGGEEEKRGTRTKRLVNFS